MKNREMVIETWNSQRSNRYMYLRSQGVDVPNVKVQLYYHGIKSAGWTSPFLDCKISFRIKALYKNKGKLPNF